MSIIKKLLSVTLSCSIGFWSFAVVYPSALAANDHDNNVCLYNNINLTESKDPISDEEPFHVFDIYDAFYGITTTTTTSTTTTTTTTTTVTSTETTTTSDVGTNSTETTTALTTTASITTTSAETTTASKTNNTTTNNTTTNATTTKNTTTTTTKATTTKATTTKTTTTKATTPTTTAPTTTSTAASTTTTAISTDIPVGTTSAITPNFPNGLYLRGIDVSEHQGWIDWTSVKESGLVDFAIIRAGYGRELYQIDKFFKYNMQNAQANGIDVGIYWYSYASTPEEAIMEAQTCYEIIKDYSFTYPIYFDIEERKITDNLTTAEVSALLDAFCSFFEGKGYYAGAYSYANLLQTKFYKSVLEKYDVWVAQYDSQLTAYNGHYGIWQYSSKGAVDGINGVVDMNYCYKDYPLIIGTNPCTGDRPSIPITTTQTDSSSVPVQTTTTVSFISSPQSCGIDISAENGDIDWDIAAVSGEFSFMMLKAGEGGAIPQKDEYFDRNFNAVKSRGIPCGVYWQAKSTTVEGIRAEAVKFYEIVKGRQFEYPMFLDLTDESITQAGLSSSQLWELIDNFCLYLENRGCYIGIRGSEQFLQTSIDPAVFAKYDIWLDSDIPFTPTFEYSYGMIFIGNINVSGINGILNANFANKNYAMIMKRNHLNGF